MKCQWAELGRWMCMCCGGSQECTLFECAPVEDAALTCAAVARSACAASASGPHMQLADTLQAVFLAMSPSPGCRARKVWRTSRVYNQFAITHAMGICAHLNIKLKIRIRLPVWCVAATSVNVKGLNFVGCPGYVNPGFILTISKNSRSTVKKLFSRFI